MNIAAYCRVSTDKDDQLNSLDAQKQFFEEYAEKNRHNLVRIYADEGISGTKIKNRVEFQRLLRDANHKIFDMVVVKDISRFARNTVDLLNSTRQLKSLGIETMFLTANMTVLGNSEFVLTIFGALAQEESANTSKRVKFGKKMNAQKGRVPNLVFGYDKTKGDYFNLAINEFEANTVRRIFNLYVKDGFGANKIAQILNNENIRTKRRCKWSQNAVSRILTNEIYVGKIINGKQEVEDFLTGTRREKQECEWQITERPDLAIIDQTTFDKTAKIIANRNRSLNASRHRQSNRHLFSTIIRCSCCDYSFRRIEKTYKNTYISWVCSGRNINGASTCNNLNKINEADLIAEIKAYFKHVLSRKENVIKNIIKEFNRIYHAKDDDLNYEKELTDKLTANNKARQKYLDMYTDDLISREELREKVGIINAETEWLKNKLKLIKCNTNKSGELEKILNKTFADLESILSIEHMTNAQLKRIINKIVADKNGKIDVYFKPLGDINLNKNAPISYIQA